MNMEWYHRKQYNVQSLSLIHICSKCGDRRLDREFTELEHTVFDPGRDADEQYFFDE